MFERQKGEGRRGGHREKEDREVYYLQVWTASNGKGQEAFPTQMAGLMTVDTTGLQAFTARKLQSGAKL